jgi:hypothetical protein
MKAVPFSPRGTVMDVLAALDSSADTRLYQRRWRPCRLNQGDRYFLRDWLR